jgi:hypothetical protein
MNSALSSDSVLLMIDSRCTMVSPYYRSAGSWLFPPRARACAHQALVAGALAACTWALHRADAGGFTVGTA